MFVFKGKKKTVSWVNSVVPHRLGCLASCLLLPLENQHLMGVHTAKTPWGAVGVSPISPCCGGCKTGPGTCKGKTKAEEMKAVSLQPRLGGFREPPWGLEEAVAVAAWSGLWRLCGQAGQGRSWRVERPRHCGLGWLRANRKRLYKRCAKISPSKQLTLDAWFPFSILGPPRK